MKPIPQFTKSAAVTARFGLAFVLAACSGQSGALPVANGAQVEMAPSRSALEPASFDAFGSVVSTAARPVKIKTIRWPALPKAAAGTAFAHAVKIKIVALDASGKRITGTYATPIELTDGDTSGATRLLIANKPASSKNRLTKSSDVVALSYDGLAIPPVALSAKAGGKAFKATFTPVLQKIVYSGPTSGSPPAASILLSSSTTSVSFSASEVGWTNAPYDKSLRAVAGSSCASFATVSSTSTTSFAVNATSSPAAGTCDITVEDFAGGNTFVVAANYASATLNRVPLFVTTGNSGNGVYQVPVGCATASCVINVGGGYQQPFGAAFDSSGNLWVADQAGFGSSPLFEMAPTCMSASCVTSSPISIDGPSAIAFDATGNAFVVGGSATGLNGNLYKVPAGCTTQSCVQTLVTGLYLPTGVAVDASGDVFIADQGFAALELPHGSSCATVDCLVQIENGTAQDGFPATVVAAHGVVYFAYVNPVAIVMKEPVSCVSVASDCFTQVGGSIQGPWGIAVDGNDDVYIADTAASALYGVPPGCAAASCMVNITPSGAFTGLYGVAVQSAPIGDRRRR
jgi:hypothetical protein